MSDEPEQNPRNVDEFLATARKRFEAAEEEERELRDAFVDDLKFASPGGDGQWNEQLKQSRMTAGRPVMVFPRCHTFVQQVANQARQQKPQIKYAQGDGGNKDDAEIMEGIARHIQYDSDAQVAYDTAIEYSAAGSFGYYRILTDYCDDDSEDQEIKVLPILDPLMVYGVLVPAIFRRKPRYWFVIVDMPKEEYVATYGDKFMSNSLDWAGAAKESDGWITDETVRIAEYWYTEEKRVKGKRRPQTTIKFCKTNGLEILDGDDGESSETVWPGTRCNIIPVLGSQLIIAGKPQLFSVVRPQKDAQRMLNYAKSRIAETLAQSPVSPFIAVEGQIAGREAEWNTINSVPRSVVQFKAVDVNGQPAPPPQRQTFEPPIAALSSFVAQEVDDMKATTGIFDASLGNKGNEQSGKAIFERRQQSNLSTMHFMDNLERAFRQGGDVIGELIPIIYGGRRNSKRLVKMLGADESQKLAQINFDLSSLDGTWVVTSGKSYSAKRGETFDTTSQIIQSAPNMFPIIGDIMLRNSDMAGADEAADRIHAMLPPALQKDSKNPMPPEAQQVVMQAQQQMGMMQQELQKLTAEKQGKVWETQGKIHLIEVQHQANLELEDKKLLAQITVAEIETKAQNQNERIASLEQLMSQFHDNAHDLAMQAQQQGHEKEMAQVQAQHQAQLADQSAENQSAQSAQDAAQSQAVQEPAE